MKCPIRHHQQMLKPDHISTFDHECIQEECAWWVKASQSCAMEAIPRIIGYLGSELKTIKEQMPPARE